MFLPAEAMVSVPPYMRSEPVHMRLGFLPSQGDTVTVTSPEVVDLFSVMSPALESLLENPESPNSEYALSAEKSNLTSSAYMLPHSISNMLSSEKRKVFVIMFWFKLYMFTICLQSYIFFSNLQNYELPCL